MLKLDEKEINIIIFTKLLKENPTLAEFFADIIILV
jgi:hypothetical protein